MGAAVNLSPRQFQQADLPALVHSILIETSLSPARLELEITETALFEDLQRALDALRRLRALGVSIAMDDFGTGYSSLSSLQAFPFDKIKIDREFVEHLRERKQAAMIVRSVLGLGKSLEIPVLAEGVETHEQLEFLRSIECEEVQGYYFGRPASAEQIRQIVASGCQSPHSGGSARRRGTLRENQAYGDCRRQGRSQAVTCGLA